MLLCLVEVQRDIFCEPSVKSENDRHITKWKVYKLMCNFYSLIMVFPGYLLFHLIVGKLFSLQNLALSLS